MEATRLLLLCCAIICAVSGALPAATTITPPPMSADCDLECTEGEVPVCGDDGRTYPSACAVEKTRRCQGAPVQVRHEGKCASGGRCWARRAALLSGGVAREGGAFVPECREDGSYAEVQCHASTGYCWCVDGQGKPVRGSSIQHARPLCQQHKGRRTNRRRSSRGRKNKKGCGTSDRANFNANLIDIFQSEYDRVDHPTDEAQPGDDDPLRDTREKRVVQWKFDQLDGDGDSALRRSEVRDLRRMARRIVRPRGCARTFAKFCDLDQDRRISRAEWAVCVGVDINNERSDGLEDFMDDQPKGGGVSLRPEEEDGSEPWDRESHVPRLYQITPDNDARKQEDKEEEAESQDCAAARAAALEVDRQAPGAGTYVPECASSGGYARAQCSRRRSALYCWCVHPRTGRPVRGTATQNSEPDCDAPRTTKNNFKGCSLHKKQEFLDELIRSFSKEMQDDATNKSLSIDTPTPEKAARWKFANTDANSNGVLEKREWKAFRLEWRTAQVEGRLRRRLRKCWRNLPRFCDENEDQRIGMDEWLACTVAVRDSKSGLPRNNRRGKNPLTTILKSDR